MKDGQPIYIRDPERIKQRHISMALRRLDAIQPLTKYLPVAAIALPFGANLIAQSFPESREQILNTCWTYNALLLGGATLLWSSVIYDLVGIYSAYRKELRRVKTK